MDVQVKQQVVELLKKSTNILVTVNANPSVDQLAACIGFTLLLNKAGKHATAVFSGKVPSTIEFLQPEKTIQTNTDSLRDFIISLDKAKADKLRYKVEDQFVKIFITPYKTSISQSDLVFSDGDYNVEVIMALGVSNQAQLDASITAHGKILHDAAVVSVNAGNSKGPALGQVDWRDPAASSLSEMIVSISEALGSNLLDAQMATALLTGIVSETGRFANVKTSPKVMTMSAQLMAAGANQQLIVKELEPPKPAAPTVVEATLQEPDEPDGPVQRKPKEMGALNVKHDDTKQDSEEVDVDTNEISIDNEGTLRRAAELLKAQQAVESASGDSADQSSATLSTNPPEPLEPPQTPEPQPDNQPPSVNPHAFLSSDAGSGTGFAAGMQAESEDSVVDPLAEDHSQVGGLLTHGADVEAPDETDDTVPPPPFPPPMNLGAGVVIPPSPSVSKPSDKAK